MARAISGWEVKAWDVQGSGQALYRLIKGTWSAHDFGILEPNCRHPVFRVNILNSLR